MFRLSTLADKCSPFPGRIRNALLCGPVLLGAELEVLAWAVGLSPCSTHSWTASWEQALQPASSAAGAPKGAQWGNPTVWREVAITNPQVLLPWLRCHRRTAARVQSWLGDALRVGGSHYSKRSRRCLAKREAGGGVTSACTLLIVNPEQAMMRSLFHSVPPAVLSCIPWILRAGHWGGSSEGDVWEVRASPKGGFPGGPLLGPPTEVFHRMLGSSCLLEQRWMSLSIAHPRDRLQWNGESKSHGLAM